jgi:hypothetical protein
MCQAATTSDVIRSGSARRLASILANARPGTACHHPEMLRDMVEREESAEMVGGSA